MIAGRLNNPELARKGIHIANSAIPLIYYYRMSQDLILRILLILAFIALLIEYLRLHYPRLQQLFINLVGPALRNHESNHLTGATYVFAGMVFTAFLFPKEIAVPAMLTLSVADAMAAVIGIPFGRHRFLAKSLEGSLTFFIFTCTILAIYALVSWPAILIVALIVTVVEAYPKSFDDNILIPLTVGSLLYLARFLPF